MKTRKQMTDKTNLNERSELSVQDARVHAGMPLRNLGIAAHVDAGKTTLTERVLFHTGAIHKCGDVDSGNTVTDSGSIEKAKGITINSAAVNCRWTQSGAGRDFGFAGIEHQLNIIDTPGHVDFTVEVERSLRVLDGLVLVVCAVGRVQPQTETVWRQANRYGTPRIVFVNKMDRMGADFEATVRDVAEKLSVQPLPVVIPIGAEAELAGQIDIINECQIGFEGELGCEVTNRPLNGEIANRIRQRRDELVETVANLDEQLSEAFLSERPVTNVELIQAIRRVTLAGVAVPVIGGSAFRYVGVQSLIDATVDYLPDPLESAPIIGEQPDSGTKMTVRRTDSSPRALVFKIECDDHAGLLAYLRVYSGRIAKGDSLLVPRTGKRVRIGRLLRMQGSRREPTELASAGEIVAVVGLNQVGTGDTLCDVDAPILLERPAFPEPVVSVAIEPERSEDRKNLGIALQKMVAEDPTLQVTSDPETGQTLLAGMGELHLNVRLETLGERYGVNTSTGAPRIAYRETIRSCAHANHLLKKQDGGKGMYARVVLDVAPGKPDSGIIIEDRIVGGAIPSMYLSACHRGIEIAAGKGTLAGYPMVDVQVTLVDGDDHSDDSSDLSFQIAAEAAMREALFEADPVLLEPVMQVTCELPDEYRGSVLGDLTRRRAIIKGMESIGTDVIVSAEVSLAQMFRYATDLRTLTKGRGTYSMQPCRFSEAQVADVKAVKAAA